MEKTVKALSLLSERSGWRSLGPQGSAGKSNDLSEVQNGAVSESGL